MTPDEEVFEVQRLYPQIYLACHRNHVRAVSTRFRISSQDASILVHLDRVSAVSPQQLAKHLGVSPSTLSAAIARLGKLGYLDVRTNERDRRKRELRLTKRGAQAISVTSVLDQQKLLAVLNQLNATERKQALDGLGLLAAAARRQRE
jgi:DNA-binding MarR family transcriptional regulator